MTTDPEPVPVVMLHGFTQTGRCLGPLAAELAESRPVLTPDLPGHGSNAAAATLDCPAAAAQLAGSRDRADWLGYSLGGRIALLVALDHPQVVERLVLLSTTAGLEDRAVRAARRNLDRRRADHIESVGVTRFLAEWLATDMFSALEPWARFADERATNSAAGLAGSLRYCGTGSMTPVWERLPSLEMPVLLLAGSLDEPYVEAARRMASAIGPNASVEVVQGCHHAVHLEDPLAVTALVEDFLDR